MNAAESLNLLHERIAVSEIGRDLANDPLMDLDIWSVLEIGYTEEESNIMGVRNIYFKNFSLLWLKLLAKLTVKASIREKCSLDTTGMRIRILRQLDEFLSSQGYNRPEILTDSLLQEFVSQSASHKRQFTIIYAVRLWAEERWIQLSYTPPRYKKTTPRIETIPEEVLCQIYNNFDVLPPPLERLFRLQLVLGCRINEVIRMPRQCLKQEGDKWFLLRWIAKRKHWKFYQIHPLVAELVRAQQKFLDTQQSINDNFDKLFCMTYAAHSGGSTTVVTTRFDRKPVYLSKIFNKTTLNSWLQDFSKKADLKDKHSNQFNLTSHQFRRTKASIMAYCETDDEYIAAVLGHASLDMLPHYRKQDLNRLDLREISPQWYRVEVKKYLCLFVKLPTFSSDISLRDVISTLKYFGCIVEKFNIYKSSNISREMVLAFKDTCVKNAGQTINRKLKELKDFFEYLELDTSHLIRDRDKLKTIRSDPDWLDELTRQAIHQHLSKIPAPIARHYLIQEYTATRPSDACNITFDCLVEENGKWYVRFSEGKKKRGKQGKENRPEYHQLPATREIRRVIEEQQYWIRETLGAEYSYLLCHFRGVNSRTYPSFPGIKPLPEPPNSGVDSNQMVRIIRMLIDREDIRDANDLKPHFVGKITRPSKLQEIRAEHGMEVAQLYANHARSNTTFQHYAPPTREQIAAVDLPFQALLMNPSNKFLPWQSLPESLLTNPKAHELDSEIAPRLVVYGHCILNPKTPCPVNLYPKCYGCGSFRPSTAKLPLYERQHQGEQLRLRDAEQAGAELAAEEAKATIAAMDIWLPELRRLAND